jgi:hypothetical protein
MTQYCPICAATLTLGFCPYCKPCNCAMCDRELSLHTQGELKGLCRQCCKGLGGGVHSARGVIAGEKQIARERGRK